MKPWFALAFAFVLGPALVTGEEDWVKSDLNEAAKRFDQRQFSLAHDIYRNLLLAHQAAPLGATVLEQARAGIAATTARLKADESGSPGAAFVERAKRLGFAQVGAAWLPAQVKERLSADATARLRRLAQGKACPACKGQGVNVCPNCAFGKVRCMGCSGTGRTGGSAITSRGAPCPACDGRGRAKCLLCKGTGYGVCPKCEGIGAVE
ncbi:MAG: hypothetical protein HZA91_17645 [Verrucomicrobia bacterium]|nr:hypothetical protein [Verrucomicrobiota bacterium]